MNKSYKYIFMLLGAVVGLYFLISGLIEAKGFLMPFALAMLIALLLLPLAGWLEHRGMGRALAAILSDFVVIIILLGVLSIVSVQITTFVNDWPKIKDKLKPTVDKMGNYTQRHFGVTLEDAGEYFKKGVTKGGDDNKAQSSPSTGKKEKSDSPPIPASAVTSTLSAFTGALGSALLVFVYVFFLLFYRRRFATTIMRLAPANRQKFTNGVVMRSINVAKKYLGGRLLLIVFLSLFYSLGLSLTGIDFPVLTAILAAVLTLIPFLGNVLGFVISLAVGFISGDIEITRIFLGVLITFSVGQFIESYILEPFIVGENVGLNAVFTIIAIIAGGAVWGIAGMVLAIPALGVVKVFLDQIPELSPIGFMIGNEPIDGGESDGLVEKIKRWSKNLRQKLRSD